MYTTTEQQELDRERLYQQLLNPGEIEFSMNLSWLSDKALASDAPDRFAQMWRVYFAVMGTVGDELFGEDICWNPDSYLVGLDIEKLLEKGYENNLHQLILGARNLFLQLRLPHANSAALQLERLSEQLHKTTSYYCSQGVRTTQNCQFRWGYIDSANRIYGDAYNIVKEAAYPPEPVKITLKERISKLFQPLSTVILILREIISILMDSLLPKKH